MRRHLGNVVGMLLSSIEVCRRARITYRQLDYWVRTGVVEPTVDARGSGTQRRFTPAVAEHVVTLARYLRMGLALDAARAAAEDPWAFAEQALDMAESAAPPDAALAVA